ncbi:hypothetical protein ACFQJC_15235 [Haloferax namakaokahaiae]|uniref:Uncharacterized protein n=1 Tax=Haloferax namakaokahaiae TaxID=1748331 RepID=A0ABD5ZI31_9EURY
MRIRLPDGTVRTGHAIDLSAFEFDPELVVEAVRADADADAVSDGDTSDLSIDCPAPGPGHETLGVVPGSSRSDGHLLEAVGRSRGVTTPFDSDLTRLDDRLLELSESVNVAPPDLDAARQRVAETGDDVARLREETAALRGRLAAHREAEATDAIEATRTKLRETTTKLSEVETERIAAEQRLSALEREARNVRDRRERRLKLEDALDNRRREVRAYFRDRYAAELERAVEALSQFDTATTADESLVKTLACVRLAHLDAPVVLACDVFDDAETAADTLDTPVVRL